MHYDLIITNGHLITMDPALGDLVGADIAVRGGVIADIAPGLATTATYGQLIDAHGKLVLPGLVDAHRHVWQGALGGYTGQVSLRGYVKTVIGGLAPHYTAEDLYAGTLWGALQCLNAGITTVADWSHNLRTGEHADANVRALHDSGIRALFLHGGPGPADGPESPHPSDVRRVLDQFRPSDHRGRLRMGLAVRGPAFSSPEATTADISLARELGLPMSIHVGMSGFAGSVETLHRLGLLGPDINFAHGNQLTDHEWKLIDDCGASLAITPSIDLLMALGSYPATGEALSCGVPAGLGVDTTAGTGTDLFSEMRIALATERSRANLAAVAKDEAVAEVDLDQRDMLRLATIGGAQAWQLADQIGTLIPGKQADLIIIDQHVPHLDGFGDPVASVVMGAGARDVDTVVVAGTVVKAGGELLGSHAIRARELMRESRARLTARVG